MKGWGSNDDDNETAQEKLEKRVAKLEQEKRDREDDDNFSMTGSYYHDD